MHKASVVANISGWNQEMDRAILSALESARAGFPGVLSGRRQEIISIAYQWMSERYPFLRSSFSPKMLDMRIRELNSRKKVDDPTYIWVDRRLAVSDDVRGPEAEAIKQLIMGRELAKIEHEQEVAAAVSVAEYKEPAPAPQPVQPLLDEQQLTQLVRPVVASSNLVAATVKLLTEAIKEADGSNRLVFDELLELHATMRRTAASLDTTVQRLETLTTALVSCLDLLPMKVTKQIKEDVAQVKISKVVPTLPEKKGGIYSITREICTGTAWDKLNERPLTDNERNFIELYEFKIKQWREHRELQTPPTIIIYGWDATLGDVQSVFYRLGPAQICWIPTYGMTQESALNQVVKIHPSSGQVLLVYNKMNHKDTAPGHIDLLKKRSLAAVTEARKWDIPYWTGSYDPHQGRLPTNDIAYHFLSRVWSKEWATFRSNTSGASGKEE